MSESSSGQWQCMSTPVDKDAGGGGGDDVVLGGGDAVDAGGGDGDAVDAGGGDVDDESVAAAATRLQPLVLALKYAQHHAEHDGGIETTKSGHGVHRHTSTWSWRRGRQK